MPRSLLPTRPAVLLALLGSASAASFSSSFAATPAPAGPIDRAELRGFLDEFARREMPKYGVPGAVAAVVENGRVVALVGWGWANLLRRIPVDPARTIFKVGSVSKPVTATAVMQCAERGLRLDRDVATVLSDVHFPEPFGRAVTPHDLLTHTAGLDVSLVGTAAPSLAAVQPLGLYLAAHLPPPVRPPGRLIAYSNHGYCLLGHLVEEVSGRPFADYVRSEILLPLGMRHSGYTLDAALRRDLATGYETRASGRRIAPPVYPNIGPAAGFAATGEDMARFLIAHLEGGRGILRPETLGAMHARHFTQDPRMPGLAYGFFESFENRLRILFHGGGIRGFAAGIYLIPERRLGFFVANNGGSEAFVWHFADRFLDRFFPVSRPALEPRPGVSAREFAGSYLIANQPETNLEKAGALRGREIEVRARDDGTLAIWGERFVAIGPRLFKAAASEERVAFGRDARGRIAYLFTEDLFLGNQTWARVPAYATGNAQSALFLLFVLLFAFALFFRPPEGDLRLFDLPPEPVPAARRAVRLGVLVSALHLVFFALAILGFRQAAQGAGLLYGVPWLLRAALALPVLATPFALALVYASAQAWRFRWWSPAFRTYHTALALGAVAFFGLLARWNLFGWRW